ncbi:DUF1310 family protein [Companilactobacillus sp. DQM5]|uniref:DUF1310 family protein n=1 Tax=Companilactobacillus sp. DQM5 TaxID=3463359 RepID=UPI0040590D07
MNKKRKILIVILSLAIIVIGIGVKIHMDNVRFHEEMVKVVKSDEGQKAINSFFKKIDKNAFTQNGKIKKITIQYDQIVHNPMGGIDVIGFVNDNEKFDFDIGLNKYNNKLKADSGTYSSELDDFLTEGQNNVEKIK